MNHNPALRFEFTPSSDPDRREDGWGEGILYLSGRPYWFFGTQEKSEPISWTWIDFLEYVAQHWAFLISEQSYPFPWLNEAPHPGDVWSIAESRWSRQTDDVADEEESRLISFEGRHNLALAWKGMSLPSLIWLRNGSVVWICAEDCPPIRAPFDECRDALIKACNSISNAFSNSNNPRVAKAIARWNARGDVLCHDFFSVITGLSKSDLQSIQEGESADSFWEISANSSLWADGKIIEGELLAAARMSSGLLDKGALSRVLHDIKSIPRFKASSLLDGLSDAVLRKFDKKQPLSAFEAGYVAAEVVRNKLSATNKYFDILHVLEKLGVEIRNIQMRSGAIDAIAIWGSRGPCILLNQDRDHSSVEERTRMTLAHEFAHVIVDRRGGLPFCEVLGGAVDNYMERRANSFAAELLLPRSLVKHKWDLWKKSFHEFLNELVQEYRVSKMVACAQIFNSEVFFRLEAPARNEIESRLHREHELQTNGALKIQMIGGVI